MQFPLILPEQIHCLVDKLPSQLSQTHIVNVCSCLRRAAQTGIFRQDTGLPVLSRATMPNLSLIPKRVIIARASFVACSISLEAPVVMDPNTSSSAHLPPVSGLRSVVDLDFLF